MLYVVGDVHGQLGQLDRALALIEADGGRDAPVVFVGDYIDRGPDSRDVVEKLLVGLEQGRNWTCLKGNHDRMFTWFMEAFPRQEPHLPIDLSWLHERLGGLTTLTSYGVDISGRPRMWDLHKQARALVPTEHLDFLASRPLSFETEELFICHAGIRPGVALKDQSESDLLWIRQGFIDDATAHPKLVVHGHTALDHPEHRGNRINLDGGAGYDRDLWPARFDGAQCSLLTDSGTVPLTPKG